MGEGGKTCQLDSFHHSERRGGMGEIEHPQDLAGEVKAVAGGVEFS